MDTDACACPPEPNPALCSFAQAFVLPRFSRLEADLLHRGTDVDAAHHQLRTVSNRVQELAIAQSETERRVARLELAIESHATSMHTMDRRIDEIRHAVDNLAQTNLAISEGVHALRVQFTQFDVKNDQQHRARIRAMVTMSGLLGSVVAFVFIAVETLTEKTVVGVVKAWVTGMF